MTASLGSALSLVSELRWYLQRYVDEVLITEDGSVYLTWELADCVYERGVTLSQPWARRFRYRIHGGRIYRSAWDLAAFGDASPQATVDSEAQGTGSPDQILEVWGISGEYPEPRREDPDIQEEPEV